MLRRRSGRGRLFLVGGHAARGWTGDGAAGTSLTAVALRGRRLHVGLRGCGEAPRSGGVAVHTGKDPAHPDFPRRTHES